MIRLCSYLSNDFNFHERSFGKHKTFNLKQTLELDKFFLNKKRFDSFKNSGSRLLWSLWDREKLIILIEW